MSRLVSIRAPTVDALAISIQPPNRLKLEGRITHQEPGKLLGGFLKSIHDAAIGDKLATFEVDMPHPRKLSSPQAQRLREAILKELGL